MQKIAPIDAGEVPATAFYIRPTNARTRQGAAYPENRHPLSPKNQMEGLGTPWGDLSHGKYDSVVLCSLYG